MPEWAVGRWQVRVLLLCSCVLSGGHGMAQAAESVLGHLLPSPARSETLANGSFHPDGAVIVAGAALRNESAYLATHLSLPVSPATRPEGRKRIELSVAADLSGTPEGYRLKVEPECISILGGAPAGVFRGIQTLRQMMELGDGRVPLVIVEDAPEYGWRGIMLDCARRFYNVDEIKQLLDQMARYKLNVFHWHLIDNEAWRLEIKEYPELTARNGQQMYTQEQVKDVVAYAAARHIRVLPEIEMPGHSVAALRAMPSLRCDPKKGAGVYCAGKEEVFVYADRVMREVAELFPEPFVHIGADEVRFDNWRVCPDCQARMKQEGIKQVKHLQGYFVRRVEQILKKHGKRLIGWDEIAEDNLSTDAVVMYWRSRPKHKGIPGKAVHKAALAGHNVVLSPQTYCYYDFLQGDWTKEPRGWNGTVTLEGTYGLDLGMDALPRERVLGGQANVWTTRIRSNQMLHYMVFPRVLALAEVFWRGEDRGTYNAFIQRFRPHLRLLEEDGIAFRFPVNVEAKLTDRGVVLLPELRGARVVYTLDGTDPKADSQGYDTPIAWFAGDTPLLHIKAAVVKPNGGIGRTEDLFVADFVDMGKARIERVSSQQGGASAKCGIDGSLWRCWQSEPVDADVSSPHEIVVDLGAVQNLHGIVYYPRQDGSLHGHFMDFEIRVSETAEGEGTSVAEGTWTPSRVAKTQAFPKTHGRYLILRCRKGQGGSASMGNLKVF